MPTASDLYPGGIVPDSISVPGVHPSMTPEDTVQYWQNKDQISSALDEAMKAGVNKDNYIEIMSERAKNGDVGAIEWLANMYATKDSEKTAREWTAEREDSSYQRLVADLSKAGISPYVLSGATPAVSSSSGHSYSGSQIVSRANNSKTTETSQKNAQMQAVLRIAGVIGAALIYALMA